MIVTLTANPSLDRTVALAGPLERGAVIARRVGSSTRPAARASTSPAPSVAAGVPSSPCCPRRRRRPDRPRAAARAGIDCRPVADRRRRSASTSPLTEPDGTTTKLNSPARRRRPTSSAGSTEALRRRAGERRLGRALRLAAARRPRRLVRRAGRRAARHRRPGRRRHLARRRCSRCVDGSAGAAPDLLKPNAEELAPLTGDDRGRARGRPASPPRGRRDARRPRGRRPCWSPSAATAPCSSPPTAPGSPRPPPITVRSTVGAGDSSLAGYLLADLRGAEPRRPAPRSPSPTAQRRAAGHCPGTTDPANPTERPTRAAPAPAAADLRPHPEERTHVRTDHHRPGRARRRPRRRQGATSSGALARRRRRRRPSDRRRRSSPPTPSPARRSRRPACPAGSRSRTAAPSASPRPTLAFARLSPKVDFGAKDGPPTSSS